ncbi:MAG: hypothetical protein ACREK8_07065 [Gemmatimonadales bacterium]
MRNATILDFPLEASVHSLLPAVDELVVNVGVSEDDTLERVHAIADPKLRVIESEWDRSRGTSMLADETQRSMAACRYGWGIYIQADEVLETGGADRLRAVIERSDADPGIEGVIVNYAHFYGGFDVVARNRKWYRREVRAVRLDPGHAVRSYRDAQGFRVGPAHRRIRAVQSEVVMFHYGWARPTWALAAKRVADGELTPALLKDVERPLLPWIPGMRTFRGRHPAVAHDWIAARRTTQRLIAPFAPRVHHLRFMASAWFERLTGWRAFEYRNYTLIRPRQAAPGHVGERATAGRGTHQTS